MPCSVSSRVRSGRFSETSETRPYTSAPSVRKLWLSSRFAVITPPAFESYSVQTVITRTASGSAGTSSTALRRTTSRTSRVSWNRSSPTRATPSPRSWIAS